MGISRRIAVAVMLCLIFTAAAEAQLSTGTISGTVQDATGAVIPGVNVTLTSVGVIGGDRNAVTNERGSYQFTRLVPGTYGVRAELPGFRPAMRQNIIINADVTVRVDLSLQVGEVTDAVTVTGEAPLLDTTTALNQAVLDRATLDKLPSGHDLWSIGRTVPGVVISKYDVGGNESFQQSSASVHGSGGDDNKYAIDGMDVGWAGGSGTVMVYFDPNMFEEINYQVGNVSAENRQGGVVMNMVTKTGTNDFHGSFMFTGTNADLQSDNIGPITGDLGKALLAAVPAKVLAANPGLKPGQQVLSFFDAAASLSGPVVKNRLWFTATYKLSSLNQLLLGNYNPDNTQAVDDNRIDNKTFKLSYKVAESSQLHYTYSRNLKDRYHRRTATYQEDRASRHQDQWADIHQLKATVTLTPKLVLDAGTSLQVGPSPYLPQKEVKQGDLPRMDTATGVSTVASSTYSSSPQYRGSANINLSYFAGGHDMKMGYQFSRLMLRDQVWSVADYPILARYRNGAPQDVIQYNAPVDTRVFSQEHGFFLQDKWSVSRKITLNLGARIDKVNAWVPAQCQPKTIFVAAQCFDEIRDVPNFLDVAPRFSLVYDLAGDGRTAIKASANMYHVGIDSGDPDRVNPYGSASNTVDWTDSNRDLIPQLNEMGAGSGFSFGSTNRYTDDLKRPFSIEYSAGIQQEIPGGIVVAGTYFHRDNRRGYGTTNSATPLSAYDPIEITIPETGMKTTIYNIKPAFRSARDNVTENRPDLGSYFNGLDITLNKRMTGRWMAMMGLSLNAERQREGLSRDNPNNNRFLGGPDGNDIPVIFKLSGIYRAPFGFEAAANLQHFTGLPEGQSYSIQRSLVPQLTNTSLTVQLVRFGTYRLPDTNMLDLSLSREFRAGSDGQMRLSPKMEIFNATNSNAIQAWSTQLNGSGASKYHNASRILNPRMIRLGLNLNF